jgi:molybdate transport system substrate-binding protein
MKKLALSLSAATVLMAYSPADAASIRVAVAPNFFKAANEIATAFNAYYLLTHGASYSVSVVSKSSSLIKTDIIAGGATGPYDLFLSSGPADPLDLYINYSSLVGTPFDYAIDTLEVYSPTIDTSGGLPYPLTADFVMPDPTVDNYGQMAALVLALGPWHILPNQIPGGHVFTASTVDASFALVQAGNYGYGFVAQSQICSYANSTYTYLPGYYHAYSLPAYVPTLLNLTAVQVNRTRTTAAATELSDFIAYLQGATSSFGDAPTRGTDLIQKYCFQLPPY